MEIMLLESVTFLSPVQPIKVWGIFVTLDGMVTEVKDVRPPIDPISVTPLVIVNDVTTALKEVCSFLKLSNPSKAEMVRAFVDVL